MDNGEEIFQKDVGSSKNHFNIYNGLIFVYFLDSMSHLSVLTVAVIASVVAFLLLLSLCLVIRHLRRKQDLQLLMKIIERCIHLPQSSS